MLIAGDIGGTNTRLAVYSKDKGPRHPLAHKVFPSAEFSGLEEIVKLFLIKCGLKVNKACFGVAGPVKEGSVEITNLPWIIEEKTLALELDLQKAKLLNDLEAIACSIPYLDNGDVEAINHGEATAPNGTIALIAPGTGLGEAFLTWDGNRYQAHASEGGHVNFAPSSNIEIDLLAYMVKQFKHVSYERVCSGIGIPNIYHFLKDTGRFDEPVWLAKELAGKENPSPVIFKYALNADKKSAICIATLDIFISIFGSEAGNLALKVLSSRGVFLGGGIPPRIISSLKQGGFMRAFTNKGRLSNFLWPIPVHVITKPDTALFGAACRGLDL